MGLLILAQNKGGSRLHADPSAKGSIQPHTYLQGLHRTGALTRWSSEQVGALGTFLQPPLLQREASPPLLLTQHPQRSSQLSQRHAISPTFAETRPPPQLSINATSKSWQHPKIEGAGLGRGMGYGGLAFPLDRSFFEKTNKPFFLPPSFFY